MEGNSLLRSSHGQMSPPQTCTVPPRVTPGASVEGRGSPRQELDLRDSSSPQGEVPAKEPFPKGAGQTMEAVTSEKAPM